MRQQRTEAAAIEAEIARLRSLALDALRRRWRLVFGRTPPAALSKDLLGRMISWRLQEQAFGGLDLGRLGAPRRLATAPAQTRHGARSRVCRPTPHRERIRSICVETFTRRMTMDEKRIARLFGLSLGGLFAIGLILSAITI